jgi:hypothetical protein
MLAKYVVVMFFTTTMGVTVAFLVMFWYFLMSVVATVGGLARQLVRLAEGVKSQMPDET